MDLRTEKRSIFTHLLHHRKHPRLVIIIAVCPDTQIDLLGEGIDFVGGGELEDAANEYMNKASD